jgi:hypothetical protein
MKLSALGPRAMGHGSLLGSSLAPYRPSQSRNGAVFVSSTSQVAAPPGFHRSRRLREQPLAWAVGSRGSSTSGHDGQAEEKRRFSEEARQA